QYGGDAGLLVPHPSRAWMGHPQFRGASPEPESSVIRSLTAEGVGLLGLDRGGVGLWAISGGSGCGCFGVGSARVDAVGVAGEEIVPLEGAADAPPEFAHAPILLYRFCIEDDGEDEFR